MARATAAAPRAGATDAAAGVAGAAAHPRHGIGTRVPRAAPPNVPLIAIAHPSGPAPSYASLSGFLGPTAASSAASKIVVVPVDVDLLTVTTISTFDASQAGLARTARAAAAGPLV